MGSGQSKSSNRNAQMRMKMKNSINELDEDDIEALGIPGVSTRARTKSNNSLKSQPEEIENTDDEYFNKIYNKRIEKSLISVNGAMKSSPVAFKSEKDAEVREAISEIEKTFKEMGDSETRLNNLNASNVEENDCNAVSIKNNNNSTAKNIISSNLSSISENFSNETSNFDNSNDSNSSSESSSSNSLSSQVCNSRNLNSQAGGGDSRSFRRDEGPHHRLQNHCPSSRRHNKSRLLEINSGTVIDSDGHDYSSSSSSGSSSSSQRELKGGEQRLLVSSRGGNNHRKQRKHQPSESLLMQQKKELNPSQLTNLHNGDNLKTALSKRHNNEINEMDWTYNPPQIDGFDFTKFKEINCKLPLSSTAILIFREEEETSKSSMPSYTKDELDLIASLEREVY